MTEVLKDFFERANLQVSDSFGLAELTDWGLKPNALPFLTSATTPESICCQGCEETCLMPITKHNDKAMIWCDKLQNMGKIAVGPEELELWRIDMQSLADWLAQLLNQPQANFIVQNRAYDLGTFEGHTLFLVRGMNWNDGANICDESSIRNVRPLIISLTKPPKNFTLPCVWIGQLLTFHKRKWAADKDRLYLALSSKLASEGNIFRKDGDFWRVCFEGKKTTIKHSNGMVYLDHLLHHPNEDVPAMILQGLVNKAPPQNKALYDEATADLKIMGSDPVIDQETLQQVRAKIERLKETVPDSTEIEQLETYLRAGSYKGTTKKFTNDNEKARGNVTQAIKKAIKNIASVSPLIGSHLQAAIKTGKCCCYNPVTNEKWH